MIEFYRAVDEYTQTQGKCPIMFYNVNYVIFIDKIDR